MNLAEELRSVPVFEDLSPEELDWLAGHMETRTLAAGEVLVYEGQPAEYMTVMLSGEIRGSKENSRDDGRVYTARAGQITGMLPFSRLTTFPLTTRAAEDSRVAVLHKDFFPEMLERIPVLQQRLVNVMADRIREVTALDQQRDKMVALGKISAGLAHELNNPAAAARRAARMLRETVEALRLANQKLDEIDLTPAQRRFLSDAEHETAGQSRPLDSLERSDREDFVAGWLEKRNIDRGWQLASDLVDAGVDSHCLAEIEAQIPAAALGPALTRFAASSMVEKLAGEIENSTARISELVGAIKEYSYMDQMAEQEIDIHTGIENTLLMLKHRWKNGVSIVREYDRSLPKICAKGSDLNQVWTNLLDNALDALDGKGEIRIRTARDMSHLMVEIADNGPGIPKEIQGKIFEPFFTTKAVGKGTGLGLDTVFRVVQAHRGTIRLDSEPGKTRFQVRLPIPQVKEKTA